MDTSERRALEQLERGELGLDEALRQAGLADDAALRRAAAWSEAVARGTLTRQERTRRAAWQRAALSAAVALTAVGSLWLSREAWAGTCTATLPAPLVTFCPNAPALAAEVNANFAALAQAITTRTGALSPASADITAKNISVAPTAALSFGAQTRQMLNLHGTGYALGVQSSTLYQRSNDAFAWFKGGVHADTANNAGGGVVLATLDGSGNLTATGTIGGSALRARGCTWVYSGENIGSDNMVHDVTCPTGQYMAGWKCTASSYLDGDCYAYCCSP